MRLEEQYGQLKAGTVRVGDNRLARDVLTTGRLDVMDAAVRIDAVDAGSLKLIDSQAASKLAQVRLGSVEVFQA